jgi:ADP-ribose pyrophosphatase YjhB (NUDIX family)
MSLDWLKTMQRLRAIAQTGLAYSPNPYDLERFHEVQQLAEQGIASLLGCAPAMIAEHYAVERGYPTPKVDVRTAVFVDGRILLVRESADGLWTMPGGWADETDSPRRAAEREVWEESGFHVTVARLVSVKNRDSHAYQPRVLGGCYKLFFLATLVDGSPRTSLETTAVEFFDIHELPAMSHARTLPADVVEAYAVHCDPNRPVIVD